MFKKIALLVLMFTFVMGTVHASSINGDYKGNPIVVVTSSGKKLETNEVPAMIYDGHTVVPISLLRQLGASVIWDGATYSVDVTIPKQTNSSDINKIKFLSKVSNHYNNLQTLGDLLNGTGNSFSLAFEEIQLYNSPRDRINISNERLNKTIERYNTTIGTTEQLITESKMYNMDIYDMREILNSFNNAIDYYKLSYKGIESYSSTRFGADFDTYLNNLKKADELTHQAILKAQDGYFKYYNEIQRFQ